jgi:hypothetical protein
MTFLATVLAAIQLTGVTGDTLRARAFFDANNVKVGDPLVLTIDFLGSADFASLHPPALSRAVRRADWKLDDASAKTDTFRDARRLTYRVRPMREGVLWFPALEFAYVGGDGSPRLVRSNEIPVHAKPGAGIVVDGMAEDEEAMPMPDGLILDAPANFTDDDLFDWQKACATTNADVFAEFDFPEAKMNEAYCAIMKGDWERAISVYSRLEWQIGQTPAIERGLVAALALRFRNPTAELPVWRQVGRPILKHGWKGRALIVFGGGAAFVLVFWLLGRIIRALACLALVSLVALPALAQARDPFAELEEMHRRMQQHMQQMMSMPSGGGGFSVSFGGEEEEPVKITASVATSKKDLQVGDSFEFILSLDVPKGNTIGQIQLSPSETFGLQGTGLTQNLPDAKSANPSNVVKRISFPVRYDVPFKGRISFDVRGMVTGRRTGNGGRFSFSFSNSFQTRSRPVDIEIKPLPTDGQPSGFSGIIADHLKLTETVDLSAPETNDVVTITYRIEHNGYMPEGWMPQGAAYEWARSDSDSARVSAVEWKRYFVATGAESTPSVQVIYYEPRSKRYLTATAPGTRLNYENR